ncbi:transporter substrate-binding domain-containing protein [Chitinimonas sp.]|uniref:substrate-binding periplasmic protein n=1 Tax=Chitinimonas sp. TaxID=1934313 RepID=UPI002F94AC1A
MYRFDPAAGLLGSPDSVYRMDFRSILFRGSLALGCLLALLPVHAAPQQTLRVTSDDWCPMICQPVAEGGFGLALARMIAKEGGWQLRFEPMPLKRGRAYVEQGHYDMLPLVTRLGALKGTEPVFSLRACFYTLPGEHWTFNGPAALASIRLGRELGYQSVAEAGSPLEAAFERMKAEGRLDLVGGAEPGALNLQKLLNRRVDAVLAERNNMRWLAGQAGETVREAGCLEGRFAHYYAFSPHFPPEQLARWQRAQRKVLASKAYQALQRRYGVVLD